LNRQDFQNLAVMRLKDAEVLLNNNQYSGAYYLSGYVVECALKACIAKNTREFDFHDKKIVAESYTHDLEKLVKATKLDTQLKSTTKININFESNWAVTKDWTEESRYTTHTQQQAEQIYSAISDPNNGVLQWLQQHW
jgi:HEPN domain-containing protein